MPKNPNSGNAPGLPAARLDEIQDCITLALDATERPSGYTQAEREARSYLRSAMRQARKLRAEQIGGAA